ncbi:MAG: 50S ribosomal protein L22 [Fibrobacteres bacterium]|nr:50S ribosomal protein L22 [Fibrobacterota bacterium]
MESRAKLNRLLMSARKVRQVADVIRSKGVDDALNYLAALKGMKRAIEPLEKTVKSAVANFMQVNPSAQTDKLVIKQLLVDSASSQKRIRARAKGSAYRRLKRSSHITVVISD